MAAALIPMIASTALSAYGNYYAGQSKQAEDNFQAAQLTQNAGQAKASGQIAALNQDRNTSLMVSRARAVAAASGGSVNDSSVQNIMARIAGEGAYRSNVDRYQGETQARGMNMEASALKFQGDQAAKGGDLNALSSVISGSANTYSMYNKYYAGTSGTNDGSATITQSGWD